MSTQPPAKPIYSLFQHSVHAWRATTFEDLQSVIDKDGEETLKKTDMWGSIPIMWALRYKAKDEVVARMIELYPKCTKVKNQDNMFAITYAHEYNASKAVIEMLKFPETAKNFKLPPDIYAGIDDDEGGDDTM